MRPVREMTKKPGSGVGEARQLGGGRASPNIQLLNDLQDQVPDSGGGI